MRSNSLTPFNTVSVSVIIVSFNSERFIRQCLEALTASIFPIFEIVVVDNASQDRTCDVVANSFPLVRLIKSSNNLGFGGGCNLGLMHVTGEIVAFINPDVIVKPEWLGELTRVMAQDESVAVVGGKLLYDDQRTIQHAGGFLHYPLALADHYGYGQSDVGKWDEQRDVEYVTGAALAIRREAIDTLGGFDVQFFPAYFEETDFCFRARKAGFRVVYVPSAIGIHYESVTTGKDSYDYFYYYHLNRLRFVLKNYDLNPLLRDFFPAELDRLKIISPVAEKRALDEVYKEILNSIQSQKSEGAETVAPGSDDDLIKSMEQLSQRANEIFYPNRGTVGGKLAALGTNVVHRFLGFVLKS